MKQKLTALLLAGALLFALSACAGTAQPSSLQDDGVLTIAATTYPVYELVRTLTDGMDGVEVRLVISQQVSCLHDYTLTVNNMRTLEEADVIVINGAGLEEFMDSALDAADVPVIDASEGISLLPASGEDAHDHAHGSGDAHEEEYDPHIWLDPWRYQQMMDHVARGLSELGYGNYEKDYLSVLHAADEQAETAASAWKERFSMLPQEKRLLITFHDGFSYFADAYGLTILRAIEEEAGSEASAKDIREIVDLVREYDIPIIFVEENGSDATAKAIQRETGVEIGTLSMLMSDNGEAYSDRVEKNLETVYNGLSGEKVTENA